MKVQRFHTENVEPNFLCYGSFSLKVSLGALSLVLGHNCYIRSYFIYAHWSVYNLKYEMQI